MSNNKASNPNPSGLSRVVERDQIADFENNKRPLSSDSEEETNKQRRVEDRIPEVQGPIPLYLTVRHKEEGQTLAKTSPFLINKAFAGAGGQFI